MHESMIDHGFSLLAYKSVLIFSLDSSLVPRLLGFLPTTDRQHCRRECIPGAEDAITVHVYTACIHGFRREV